MRLERSSLSPKKNEGIDVASFSSPPAFNRLLRSARRVQDIAISSRGPKTIKGEDGRKRERAGCSVKSSTSEEGEKNAARSSVAPLLAPAKNPEIRTTAIARSHCSALGRFATSTRSFSVTGQPRGVTGMFVGAVSRSRSEQEEEEVVRDEVEVEVFKPFVETTVTTATTRGEEEED